MHCAASDAPTAEPGALRDGASDSNVKERRRDHRDPSASYQTLTIRQAKNCDVSVSATRCTKINRRQLRLSRRGLSFKQLWIGVEHQNQVLSARKLRDRSGTARAALMIAGREVTAIRWTIGRVARFGAAWTPCLQRVATSGGSNCSFIERPIY